MLFMVKDSNRLISKFWVNELIPHIHVHVYFCTYYYIKLKREIFKKNQVPLCLKKSNRKFQSCLCQTTLRGFSITNVLFKKIKNVIQGTFSRANYLKKKKKKIHWITLKRKVVIKVTRHVHVYWYKTMLNICYVYLLLHHYLHQFNMNFK